MLVRRVPMRWWRGRLSVTVASAADPADARGPDRATGGMVRRVARRLPFEAACLPQGDGGAGDAAPPSRRQPLRIRRSPRGAQRENGLHAGPTVDGQPVIGGRNAGAFTPLPAASPLPAGLHGGSAARDVVRFPASQLGAQVAPRCRVAGTRSVRPTPPGAGAAPLPLEHELTVRGVSFAVRAGASMLGSFSITSRRKGWRFPDRTWSRPSERWRRRRMPAVDYFARNLRNRSWLSASRLRARSDWSNR